MDKADNYSIVLKQRDQKAKTILNSQLFPIPKHFQIVVNTNVALF